MNRNIKKGIIISFIILFGTLFLIGCEYIQTDPVKSGEYFRQMIDLEGVYGVYFSSENTPQIIVEYKKEDGKLKTAVFQLDGYDPEKKIGYKLVVEKDKTKWDNELKNGNQETPDMNDAKAIQKAALNYDFPVIFMWAYQYQNDFDQNHIRDNGQIFMKEFIELLKTPEIKAWAEHGMYDGTWIKEEIEKMCAAGEAYKIYFSHENLPIVDLKYGNNKEAVFKLDGYDNKRQIGYKFVTADDAKNWKAQREKGDLKAPDLSKSYEIKAAALDYTFPVIFIYMPEYWKSPSITEIFIDEVQKPLDELKGWLEYNK